MLALYSTTEYESLKIPKNNFMINIIYIHFQCAIIIKTYYFAEYIFL